MVRLKIGAKIFMKKQKQPAKVKKDLIGKVVVLGADHNGVGLKAEIKKLLTEKGFVCIDIGPHDEDKKVDYVDYAMTVGRIVDNKEAGWGVLVCGTGVGMSIVANRFAGVRASLVHNLAVAQKTREHNDSNIICLGAWVNPVRENLKIVEAWITGKFGEGRHVRRVEKITPHSDGDIVFTNGIFDVLHPGHIEVLRFAKSLGGKLVVGINSDRATRELKGPTRPINNENDRKAVLEALNFVDQVIIFDDTKTLGVIKQVKPKIVVKGGEWTAEEVRWRDKIPDEIEVRVCPLVSGYSTTKTLERAQNRAKKHKY